MAATTRSDGMASRRAKARPCSFSPNFFSGEVDSLAEGLIYCCERSIRDHGCTRRARLPVEASIGLVRRAPRIHNDSNFVISAVLISKVTPFTIKLSGAHRKLQQATKGGRYGTGK